MSDAKRDGLSTQARESEIGRELFERDRGLNRDVPFDVFLTRIQQQAKEQVRQERRKVPRPE